MPLLHRCRNPSFSNPRFKNPDGSSPTDYLRPTQGLTAQSQGVISRCLVILNSFIMSLESLFAYAHRGPTPSVSLQRRLRLLQAVLPHFSTAAAQAFYAAKPFSPTRNFWTQVLSPCLVIEMGGWRFDRLDDQHDDLVGHLLQCLEHVVSMDRSAVAEVTSRYLQYNLSWSADITRRNLCHLPFLAWKH